MKIRTVESTEFSKLTASPAPSRGFAAAPRGRAPVAKVPDVAVAGDVVQVLPAAAVQHQALSVVLVDRLNLQKENAIHAQLIFNVSFPTFFSPLLMAKSGSLGLGCTRR